MSPDFVPVSFAQLANWPHDDHLAAYRCFRISAARMVREPYHSKKLGIPSNNLLQISTLCLANNLNTGRQARQFFEDHFQPHQFAGAQQGFLTGYFEPEHKASRTKTSEYQFPLYRRPPDLVDVNADNRPKTMADHFCFGRQKEQEITKYYNREQIQVGALDGQNLEIFWFKNSVDVFFVHIQGSACLTLQDGSSARVSYAAKSGHPYTAIGKILVDRQELNLADVTMQSIRAWMTENPDKRDELMAQNHSFIFFQETIQPNSDLGPVAAAGVPLSTGRSLAIDHLLHTFGTPIWVETQNPIEDCESPLARLMIAQDTGSAIIGPQRGDLFVGSGEQAGLRAGTIKHPAQMTVLVPNKVTCDA